MTETSNSVPVAGELNRKHAVSGDSGVRVSRSQSPNRRVELALLKRPVETASAARSYTVTRELSA